VFVLAARLQSPVPLSEIVCGEPEALSVNATVALNDPVVAGWKTKDREQLTPGANAVPQLLICLKEEAFAPVICTAVMFSIAEPGFWTAIV